ncbi:hypothetical protein ACWC4A_38125 [Streptomyces mirabilis]
MRTHQRVLAAALIALAAFAAVGSPAVAAPMPRDSHKIPAAVAVAGDSGTVSVLCVGGCYQ